MSFSSFAHARSLFSAPALDPGEQEAYASEIEKTRGPLIGPAVVIGVGLIAGFVGWDLMRDGQFSRVAEVRVGGAALVMALLALLRRSACGYRLQAITLYVAVYALQMAIGVAMGARSPLQLPGLLLTMFFSVLAFSRTRDALINLPLGALSVPLVLPHPAVPADVIYVAAHFVTVAILVWGATAAVQRTSIQSFSYRCQLQREAATDALTGLANRREFDLALPREIERARRLGLALTLAVVDIDHFKHVNDAHGHDVGDEVLRAVAQALQSRIRRSDVLARVGGEEFALLMLGTPPPGARVALERLRGAVHALRVHTSAGVLNCTVSIGMTEWNGGDTDGRVLYKRADDALYDAKTQGRNRLAARLAPAVAAPVEAASTTSA